MAEEDLKVGSILIGSERADELKDWYRKTFDIHEDEDGALAFGPIRLFVFPHNEIHGTASEPARIMINIHAEDARALEADLKSRGVRFIRDVSEEPFGLLGTIADLDGNYLQILQPRSEDRA